MRTSDTPRAKQNGLVYQALGLAALPVIPLYMLSYRLMGRRCTYRWPETDVRPTDYTPIHLLGSWQESPYFLSKLITGLLFVIIPSAVIWLIGTFG